MGVPVFEGDRIVALFMVANKASDYTEADVRQLGLLGSGIWKTYARMVAEEELKVAKDRAELYVDLMGHDINNMHQVALGYLELAEADMSHGDSRREYLVKPREVLQRSAQLISNVRKMQKLLDGSLHDQAIDLCMVLSDVRRELGSLPNKPITLELNGCDHCYVRANELLNDVFSNLVTNAIKHTGERTDITITLDDVEENGRRHYRVSVADNGPGISDSFKNTIFNRALKGSNKAKGMGLGLYLVKSLVDSYKGRVWVEDRVKGDHTKGARFMVLLPAIEK
jgi:signal transduction histidine kinase